MQKSILVRLNSINMKVLLALLLCLIANINCSIEMQPDNKNCIWNYRCCAHEKVNGEIKCIEMCQPEIKCDDDVPSDVETFISPVTAFQAFSVNIPSACRKGYRRDDDGICRRVFGFTTAANNHLYKYKK
ncbi:unnamed protein product [Diamesa hyperborea]